MNHNRIELIPILGFPIVKPNEDVLDLILDAFENQSLDLSPGDIVVVTHSIISISESNIRRLEEIEITDKARETSDESGQSVKRIQIALEEAMEVLRRSPILITKTKHGLITDFSGVDESNAPPNTLVLLPNNPDASALRISTKLSEKMGFRVPVIISDTQGRPWRKAAVNLAIGVAGMSPFTNNRGKMDLYERKLEGSLVCLADQIASAAELVMGQAGEGVPVVVVKGAKYESGDGTAKEILRDDSDNLFL
ncbi:MAG: coenzyme F420-0:L-glutamate ligase [Candidatus Thorarchaeota archaeon]